MAFIMQLCLLVAYTVLAACGEVDVRLSLVGRTLMQAVVTNTGQHDLNLFNQASLLVDSPVQKVTVSSNGSMLPFEGIRFMAPRLGNYTAEDFTHLPIGDSHAVRFDAAEEYDFSAGGNFTVIATGSIPYAEGTSTLLKGDTAAFRSNSIEIGVGRLMNDTVLTARARLDRSTQGIEVKDDCNGTSVSLHVEQAVTGEDGCASRAAAAAADARSNVASPLFNSYFHTGDEVHKNRVAERFEAIADACSAVGSSKVKVHCHDALGGCEPPSVARPFAYSIDYYNIIFLCDPTATIPQTSAKCLEWDVTGVMIHELSHLGAVYKPPTRDYALNWPDVTMLPPEYAMENADTYRLYAQAVAHKCPPTDESGNATDSSSATAPVPPMAR